MWRQLCLRYGHRRQQLLVLFIAPSDTGARSRQQPENQLPVPRLPSTID
jgi:hypothetical protein